MKKLLLICCVIAVAHTASAQWLKKKSPRYDRPEQYEKWFLDLRKQGLGFIPKDARLNALKQRDAMREQYRTSGKQAPQAGKPIGTLADVSWTPIGPINIEQGSVMHAGRVRSIVTHPTDPNVAYLGAAAGGVWKTSNQGRSWHPLSDDAYSLAMGAVALDPGNPNILYAGTGEANGGIDSYYGVGMLKSTDGGDTWRPSGLEYVGGFSRVIVHPTKTQTVYAAGAHSGGGLYISNDAGATWRKVGGTLPPGNVTDMSLVVDGTNEVIHVGMPSLGVYRSIDGGANWELIHAFNEMRRILIGVDQSNWRDVVAMSVSAAGSLERIDRTYNGTDWNPIATDITFGGLFGGNNQGWYDAYVHRTPGEPDRIIVGGISVWMTEDAGDRWEDVGRSYQSGGIHPDQHSAAYSAGPNPVLYVTCDGGIAVSTDNGATYEVYQDSLAITQFYGMGIDQTVDDRTYGGTQDNGTLGGGRTGDWDAIAGGDGGTVVVDESKPSRIFFVRPGEGNPPSKFDGSETQIATGIRASDSVGWVKPIVMDQLNKRLYYGTQWLYYSTTFGSSWSRRTKQLATGSFINTIEPLSGNSATVAVGTTDGRFWLTLNSTVPSAVFTERTKGLPGRSIMSIKFSPADTNTIYVATSGFGEGHVFKTTDRGVTWKNASGNLPDIPCVALVIDPEHPTNLYVGTDVGVFFSPDDGVNWLPYGNGLPNVGIGDMQYHRNKKVIRVATHGRSMWEAPMADNPSGIATPNIATTWFIGENVEIAWYGLASPVDIELSLDGGASWKPIASGVTGSSYMINNLTEAKTSRAVVKVTANGTPVLSQHFQILQRLTGGTIDVVSEQPLYMYDIAYVPEDDAIWVTNFSASDSRIYKINPNTGEQTDEINIQRTELTGIKYDTKRGTFFIQQTVTAQDISRIYEVSKTGQIIRTINSPAVYGTGVYPKGDTLFIADRNNNVIYQAVMGSEDNRYDDILLERKAAFGPRCISFNPVTNELLHTWTDFQGTEQSATLYDSYLLRLKESAEVGATFVQEGTNAGTNVRGCEYVPNSNGKAVWVTVLNSGNSSKILKISLEDGPAKVQWSKGFAGKLLKENYPNPFSSATTLTFELPEAARVGFVVRDELGRQMLTEEAGMIAAGSQTYSLELGAVPSGIYTLELWLDGERADTKRIVKQQ